MTWWRLRAWVLPLVALGAAGAVDGPRGLVQAAAMGLGLLAGAAWQLAARRDLADRLVGLSAVLLATGLLQLLTPDSPWELLGDPRGLWACGGVLAGLVLAEQGLRARSRRHVAVGRVDARVGA